MASSSTDSFSTLIDPDYQITGATRLVFDRNNIRNTTISIRSSPAYTLQTTTGTLGSKTEVIDALTKQTIASIERKELLPDVVKHKSKTIKLNRWLQKVKLPDGSFETMVEISPQSQFIWKTDGEHHLVLYPDGSDTPTARVEPATTSTPLSLLIYSGAMQFAEQILLSFLVVEQDRRIFVNSKRNMADGMMVVASSPFRTA